MTAGHDLARHLRGAGIRQVEHHEELPSTNALAVELLRPLLDDGPSLVIADRQTAGRGRGSNQWWAAEGALTFSLVFDAASVALTVEQLPLLSLCGGLAVRDCVAGSVAAPVTQIKWPNDVLVGGRKIAGVLLETHKTSDGRLGIVAGIGINVNNSMDTAPDDVREIATSMFDQTGESFDLTQVLLRLLTRWNERLDQLQNDPTSACDDWNRWNVLSDCTVTIEVGNDRFTGQCSQIDQQGRLVLESDTGQRRITAGVIRDWHA